MNNRAMRRIQSTSITVKVVFLYMLLLGLCNTVKAQDPPFTVKADLFDQTNKVSLGLDTAEGTETITVFAPSDTTDKFSNGVVLIAFKDWLYCQWQSSAKDEDAQDTWIAYSRSQDGINWSPPDTLAASINDGYCSSGGWWVKGDTIVGYINTWPNSVSPRGGYTRYTLSTDGMNWSDPKPVLMAAGDTLKGIFEQDPHALPDGRIINAAHFQPGLIISPIYTDDPLGISGWTRANYTIMGMSGILSREIEPSWFLRSDDTIVMTFRDQNGTFKRIASTSADRGENWSIPVLTDMPDSRAKQSAGNLPDSTAFMVGNPVDNKTRIPLAVTLSKDGFFFNTAYVLREGGDGIQALRYSGTAKRLGYHYPKSMVYQDYLYVSYATNKEDVEYTRVPLTSLKLDTSTTSIYSPSSSEVPKGHSLNQNFPNPFNPTTTISYSIPFAGFVTLFVYDMLGKVITKLVQKYQKANNYSVVFDATDLPSGVYIYRLKVGHNYVETRKMILLR